MLWIFQAYLVWLRLDQRHCNTSTSVFLHGKWAHNAGVWVSQAECGHSGLLSRIFTCPFYCCAFIVFCPQFLKCHITGDLNAVIQLTREGSDQLCRVTPVSSIQKQSDQLGVERQRMCTLLFRVQESQASEAWRTWGCYDLSVCFPTGTNCPAEPPWSVSSVPALIGDIPINPSPF